MRLDKVANGQRLPRKVMMRVMGLMAGAPAPDVMRTLMYRPEFFGKPYSAWLHEVMRGPSEWSVGERELFAAFTSHKNQTQFCTTAHSAASSAALGDATLVEAALSDFQRAAVGPKVKAALALLEKLTLDPDGVTREDIERVQAAGVSDAAIEDAVHLCALFNIINRLADAFDFDPSLGSTPEIVAKGANAALRFGYKI
jgi:uncharacterized peroxidase-related enzyme